MVVTAVGRRSQSGAVAEMISAAAAASSPSSSSELNTQGMGKLREETALQQKLAGYAATIGQLGLVAAVVASAALASRFTYDTFYMAQQPWEWSYLHEYLNFFVMGVTILASTSSLDFFPVFF